MKITEPTTFDFTPNEWADWEAQKIQNLARQTASTLERAEWPGEFSIVSDSYDRAVYGNATSGLTSVFTRQNIESGTEYACSTRIHTDLGVVDEISYSLWRPERTGYIVPWALAVRGIRSTLWPLQEVHKMPASKVLPSAPLNRTAKALATLVSGEKHHFIRRETVFFADGKEYQFPAAQD